MGKKVIISLLIVSGAVVGGWRFVPEDMREKTTAFIGSVPGASPGSLKDIPSAVVSRSVSFVDDLILPEDPAARQRVLVGALQENLASIKAEIGGVEESALVASGEMPGEDLSSQLAAAEQAYLEQLVVKQEELLRQLENASPQSSAVKRATEVILDKVIPNDEGCECSVE